MSQCRELGEKVGQLAIQAVVGKIADSSPSFNDAPSPTPQPTSCPHNIQSLKLLQVANLRGQRADELSTVERKHDEIRQQADCCRQRARNGPRARLPDDKKKRVDCW